MDNVLLAFLLTGIAGLSTGIGSAIAFFAKKTNTKFLALSLGFSAGVMIYVSFVELFTQANISLSDRYGDKMGLAVTVISFFAGMLVIGLIDSFIPKVDNPHELHKIEDLQMAEEYFQPDEDFPGKKNIIQQMKKDKSMNKEVKNTQKLLRTGLLTAMAIAIHNFPEGIATFASAINNPILGLSIAIAIAIHNIPEGIAVSIPIYYATGNRKRAFILSFLSGLSEPLGALIGYIVLMSIMNEVVMGVLLASVAGIMIYISFDELLPSAEEFGEHHLTIYGLVSGMVVMALSLIILK